MKDDTKLPNVLNTSITTNDKLISEKESLKSLNYENNKVRIRGYQNEQGFFIVNWCFLTNEYKYLHEWRFTKALRLALSICLGQLVEVISVELKHHHRTINTFSKFRDPKSLEYFSPIYKDTFDYELFGSILENQIEHKQYHEIVSMLFYRIVDAFKTGSFNLWGFMIPTTLEAILRTFEGKPFKEKKKEDTWRFQSSMSLLKNEFFSNQHIKDYRDVFNHASTYYIKLRNRNVHPDWINNKSDHINTESYRQILYLVKFYGYLIRAFVGAEIIKPELAPV